jgi:hypothetical protein
MSLSQQSRQTYQFYFSKKTGNGVKRLTSDVLSADEDVGYGTLSSLLGEVVLTRARERTLVVSKVALA